jgi:hypothetical protein
MKIIMMKTKKPPRYLYHATAVCNQEGIEKEGLRAGFGEVYASESEDDCLAFMGFRLMSHFHFGKKGEQPVFVEHDRLLVYEIDTKITGKSKWEVGTDHNPEFFGDATSWVHLGSIERGAIVRCIEFAPEGSK